MQNKVLVTGATGLVGQPLVQLLQAKGYSVNILTHTGAAPVANASVYRWNIYDNEIDEECLNGVTDIIHLAGENVAAHKWTKEFKNKIVQSRVLSTRMLYSLCQQKNIKLNSFICASASGYYGEGGDTTLTETHEPGNDFLADCCVLWEETADKFATIAQRVVKLRTGVILSKKGGALPQLKRLVKLYLAAPLGTGQQYMPWVHINDVVHAYLFALSTPAVKGAYNLAAPNPVTNQRFTTALANVLHRPVMPVKVPEKAIEFLQGEQSEMVLRSQKLSAQKLVNAGFHFKYADIYSALEQLLQKKATITR